MEDISFSIKGFLASIIAGFISYYLFLYLQFFYLAEAKYESDLFFSILIDGLVEFGAEDKSQLVSGYGKIKLILVGIFISYLLKLLLALYHTFSPNYNTSTYIFYLFLFEISIVGLFTGITPLKDFFSSVVIPFGIPSLIIYTFCDE